MTKQIEKKDLDRIKDIQNEYNQLIFDLGEFYFEKLQVMKDLETKESFLKELEKDFNEKNMYLTQELSQKYGNGKIDLESGTIETN